MNSLTLIGRAGRDPEVKYFEDGRLVANFTLAVNRYKRDDEPIWFTLEIWGKQAHIAADYVRKGSLIAIQGSVDLDMWEDQATGQLRSKLKVRVDRLELLGSKRDSEGDSEGFGGAGPSSAPSRRQASAGQPPVWDGNDSGAGDDIPF